jgi:gamma-glutamyl-gamma-aminobutyrate hydrolase PuuD
LKLILISQRVDQIFNRNETRDSVDQKLVEFICNAGFFPVTIPNSLISSNIYKAWISRINPDGILLSGGNSIGENEKRDLTEFFLIDYAKERKIPLLGICRGMQILAKYSGAKLKSVDNHVNTRHNLQGQISCKVNSFHNYSIINAPKNFTILAKSEDGEIEAIKHNFYPWEGWMWHPERESVFSITDIKRFKDLFNG